MVIAWDQMPLSIRIIFLLCKQRITTLLDSLSANISNIVSAYGRTVSEKVKLFILNLKYSTCEFEYRIHEMLYRVCTVAHSQYSVSWLQYSVLWRPLLDRLVSTFDNNLLRPFSGYISDYTGAHSRKGNLNIHHLDSLKSQITS
jgi:hypothetical protein